MFGEAGDCDTGESRPHRQESARHPVRRFRNTEAVMMDMRYLKSNLNVSCGCKKDACQGGIRRGI